MTLACALAMIDTRAIPLALAVIVIGSLMTAAVRIRRIVRQLEDRHS